MDSPQWSINPKSWLPDSMYKSLEKAERVDPGTVGSSEKDLGCIAVLAPFPRVSTVDKQCYLIVTV